MHIPTSVFSLIYRGNNVGGIAKSNNCFAFLTAEVPRDIKEEDKDSRCRCR